MAEVLEFGLDTFGDATLAPDGTPLSHAQVIRNVIAEGVLADEVGLNFIGIGEHHREDFAVSAPEVVMAAIAARTTNIHVGSAVTVLSSDDPIRVYQRFSEVNALSNGRAEIILGRGSFTESFPLFGFELQDYEVLFEEKLDLLVEILKEQPVTWSGSIRPALTEQRIYPPIEEGRLKAWIGVGGSPQSVVRAARHDLPLMLAIIGGDPLRFRPYVDLYHRALNEMGKDILPVGQHSPGFVADTDAEARADARAGATFTARFLSIASIIEIPLVQPMLYQPWGKTAEIHGSLCNSYQRIVQARSLINSRTNLCLILRFLIQ